MAIEEREKKNKRERERRGKDVIEGERVGIVS